MDRPYINWTPEDLNLLLSDLERMADESYGNGTQKQLAEVEAELREREFEHH
jgi:hypothetical protein